MAQVLEHLLCKYEALSSNSNPTKRKKNIRRKTLSRKLIAQIKTKQGKGPWGLGGVEGTAEVLP
jgi:hypothetical protein